MNENEKSVESNKKNFHKELDFHKELEELINRYSMENGSNTPDLVLANYLHNCLVNFDNAVNYRTMLSGDLNKLPPKALEQYNKAMSSDHPVGDISKKLKDCVKVGVNKWNQSKK